ncbi:sperm surface protein Sp17-like [Patiria miniata]|uniref:RIIa domain-containing protein n=1 Tax=Patiria miniata TaxID=46514 RepID=A0A914ANH0_PATMI|nr:sperm surface protein Sp17-like [Patiria miniata]
MSMRYGPVELSVPPGFQNILHLISQEVLREKPANTLEFIARFLDDLLAIREASGYDPVTQGEMINRVQEQYWKIVKMRKNSKLISENEMMEKTVESTPEVWGGSGDIAAPASVEENAEVLVTIAMHQENGEGTEQYQPTDEEMVDEPHLVTEQPEAVAEQPEAAPDDEQAVGSAEDTTQKEEGENLEGQDEGIEDTTDQVAMATEEEVETPAETGEVDEKNEDE